ncbi:MazG-like pyrophosphatase [Serratia phage phiMAM1]|uniref:Putative nucleoside triphosphate pyrophosphohydrolase n=1 Tax=Serratia phage phiMAM1 TaxID=1262513 RepID=K7YXX3_9CAUD|nr:MazG-like pyrophosphatase [Serratia phage phiMAM1]AFX93550.1 putative nucleoside triphosphate pyrophosphohydrolase [Serratia phage phiMAM1]
MKTTFEKVSALNLAFGNSKGDVLNPDPATVLKQAALCLEEAVEMIQEGFPGVKLVLGVDAKGRQVVTLDKSAWDGQVDLVQVLDAQGDMTTVNDGVAHIVGVDGNRVYDIVDASNRTKFIRCQEEVAPALQYYFDKGFNRGDLYLEGDFPEMCIKVTADITVQGKFYPRDKFLKNVATFKEPDFSEILAGE